MAQTNLRITQKLADKLGVSVRTATRKIALDSSVRIVERSPVDKGRFRASWRFNEGSIDNSTAPPGLNAAPRIQIPELTGKQPFFISNSLPYAVPLEEGHSQQAPLGIVGITVAEVEAEIQSYLVGKIQ